MNFCGFLVAVFFHDLPFGLGYPQGAPENDEICSSMAPLHGGAAQKGFPYTLTTDKEEVDAGGKVTLTISGGFKGFMVQVRDVGGSTPKGSFSSGGDSKTLNCFKLPHSAITHSSNNVKSSVSLTWTAPSKGTYEFVVTVLKDFSTYWVAHRWGHINVK